MVFANIVLFAVENAGKGQHQSLKVFVTEPFCKYKDANRELKSHQEKTYHENAVDSATKFIECVENKREDVSNLLDSARKH